MTVKRNWKRALKRLGLGLVVLAALLLLVNAVLNWRAGARLEAKLSRLRAADEPTSIIELAPAPLPEGQNAAVHLQRLTPQLDSFAKDYAAFYDTPLGKAYYALDDRGGLPNTEQSQAMRAVLEQHTELVAGIEQASDCEGYASLLNFSLDHPRFIEQAIEDGSRFRTVARFLKWRMQVLTVSGEPEAAVETGIQLLRLTRLIEHEPMLINHLIVIACRQSACQGLNQALRSGRITAAVRAKLNAELALHNHPARLPKVFREERAVGLNAMAEWRRGMAGRLLGWHFTNWQSALVDFYDEQLTLVENPWYQSHTTIGGAQWAADYPTVVQLLLPALLATYEASNRDRALLRCLRILNALGAYRDEQGREATGLADLDLPEEISFDPFSGKPLVVKQIDEGWLIYTVFKNGADDGGDFTDLKDWGLGPLPAAIEDSQP